VLWGMLGVTFFGLILTPMFYVLVRQLEPARRAAASEAEPPIDGGA
jgi:multidrug efflux pump